MNPFFKDFILWLRDTSHEVWARQRADSLASSVERRLVEPKYDGWDIAQDAYGDHDFDRIEMIRWLYRNERVSGTYCSPPWGRDFSRTVWLQLRSFGTADQRRGPAGSGIIFGVAPPLSEAENDRLSDLWAANGGREYEETYMLPAAKRDPPAASPTGRAPTSPNLQRIASRPSGPFFANASGGSGAGPKPSVVWDVSRPFTPIAFVGETFSGDQPPSNGYMAERVAERVAERLAERAAEQPSEHVPFIEVRERDGKREIAVSDQAIKTAVLDLLNRTGAYGSADREVRIEQLADFTYQAVVTVKK